MNSPAREPALVSIIDELRRVLGLDYFVEVDHWDGDLLAIGLARPDDLRVLVYIAVTPDSDKVFYECEVPSDEPDQMYEVAESNEHSDFDELLAVVRAHLARPGA